MMAPMVPVVPVVTLPGGNATVPENACWPCLL